MDRSRAPGARPASQPALPPVSSRMPRPPTVAPRRGCLRLARSNKTTGTSGARAAARGVGELQHQPHQRVLGIRILKVEEGIRRRRGLGGGDRGCGGGEDPKTVCEILGRELGASVL